MRSGRVRSSPVEPPHRLDLLGSLSGRACIVRKVYCGASYLACRMDE